jgi:xanthine/uracil/vitamin C permease (AzgA family)
MRMPLQQPDATSLKADILGGLTTFVTMAYIVVVNPGILATPGTGIPFSGALTATVLVAFSMTLLMGVYARLPFAVAPGMGLNAFIAQLAAAIPAYATAPVLVLVGLAMFQSVAGIDFDAIEDALPAFVTLILIPLTFSITQGVLWGFILHALLYAATGRRREVTPALWVLALLSVGLLLLDR